MSEPQTPPSPERFFTTLNAYQQSAALKAGIELDVFTAIGEGSRTPAELARRCGGAERGFRILCDYLVIIGFLTKDEGRYGLAPEAAAFLDRRSPAYMGSVADFLLNPLLMEVFKDVAGCVRNGGTLMADEGTVDTDHSIWQTFARSMMPMMALPAQAMADMVEGTDDRELKILDIAAGHGLFGIAFAKKYPKAEVTALDWPGVLQVARENAEEAGVEERYRTLPGDAFAVEFGNGYDLVLLTNFLHHFDHAMNVSLLKKVHGALGEGGRAVTLEFIPNEDRVTPPMTAGFSLTMLVTTPGGDAYTYPELEAMFKEAGFSRSEFRPLPHLPQQVVVSYK